jgi:general secretion pathway protein A
VINVLCDNCLISAFGYGKKKVGLAVVREIVADFGIRRPFYARWHLVLLAGALSALVAGVVFHGSQSVPQKSAAFAEKPRQAVPKVADRISAPASIGNPSGEDVAASRVVERGDTLARLIKEVYGHVDGKLILLVKKANPGISNENLIIEGGRIVFPSTKHNEQGTSTSFIGGTHE